MTRGFISGIYFSTFLKFTTIIINYYDYKLKHLSIISFLKHDYLHFHQNIRVFYNVFFLSTFKVLIKKIISIILFFMKFKEIIESLKAVFIVLIITSCENNTFTKVFDLEKKNSNIVINNNRSTDYSKSGKYSIKILKKNPFGLSYTFKNLKKGQQIFVSVLEKTNFSKGRFKLVDQDKKFLSVTLNRDLTADEGWDLVTVSYLLKKDYNSIKFYIYNPKEKPAYYDNLKISLIPESKKGKIPNEHIDIHLKAKDLKKLKKLREEALKCGVIGEAQKKYFKGKITYRDKTIPIKIRLKGDWIDHLESNKWSFRIIIDEGFDFKGIRKFSIQHPTTRSFLKEWLFHKIFKDENIVTPKYEFISASINNENLGIYAFEEHFDEKLISAYGYTNTPILKFNEKGLWEVRKQNSKSKVSYPFLAAAEIIPFNQKKIYESNILKELFAKGKTKMEKYRLFKEPLENIFDIKKTALMYALNDLGKIRHSNHWHNQRLFLNPITNKLEFIAYDCYSGIYEGLEDVLYGYSQSNTRCNYWKFLTKQFFNNKKFMVLYKDYLQKVSSQNYVNQIIKKYKHETDSLADLINNEFRYYQFDINYINHNAKKIRHLIPEIDTNFKFTCLEPSYGYDLINNNYFSNVGLKAKFQMKDTALFLTMRNFHLDNVSVIGYGNSKKKMKRFESKIMLEAFKKGNYFKEIEVENQFKYLFIKPHNTDRTIIIRLEKIL